MTKVTYYMYPCNTCCMISEMMSEWPRLCQVSKIKTKRDTMKIIEMFNENKTKKNSDLLLQRSKNRAVGWIQIFKERRCAFSLDLWPFGPSVLDGARRKVDLRGEGYAWTPIWWSSDNSKR